MHSLFTTDGSLLASSGDNGKVISAIFANIWTSYEKSQVGNLEYLLSECEVIFKPFFIDYYQLGIILFYCESSYLNAAPSMIIDPSHHNR